MNNKVNQEERAFRAWNVLVKYASSQEKITYKELGEKLGVHHRTCRFFLDYIQNFCLENKLPPLTIIVVNREGTVGDGFIAWDTNNLEEGTAQVFGFNWNNMINPFSYSLDGSTEKTLVDQIINGNTSYKEIYSRVKIRGVLQTLFRKALLKVYESRCSICDFSFEVALEASHIVPWSKCSDEEKLNIQNGILLCCNHHRLFDSGMLRISEAFIIFGGFGYDSDIVGKKIRLPKLRSHYPSSLFINIRRVILKH